MNFLGVGKKEVKANKPFVEIFRPVGHLQDSSKQSFAFFFPTPGFFWVYPA